MLEDKFVPGEGSSSAKIVGIGESPGEQEEGAKRPFVGPAGNLLDSCLKAAGINRKEIYLTNVRKYRPPTIYKEGKKITNAFWVFNEGEPSLTDQIAFLNEEIEAIKPNVIVGFGKNVFKSLMGFDSKKFVHRGSILTYHGRKFIGTHHPAAILHGESEEKGKYWQKAIIEFDLRRAVEESSSPKLDLPIRNLYVCQSYLDLYRFIERNEKNPPDDMFFDSDIEAFRCIPSCIALAFRPGESMSVPLFQKFGDVELTKMSISELADCWKIVAKVLANKKWKRSGQNFKYDEDKINHLGLVLASFDFDTMLASHALNPEFPHSLAFNTSIHTREPYYKDEGSDFDPRKHNISRHFLYNAKDGGVTNEIRRSQMRDIAALHLEEFFYDFVMPLHYLYSDMEKVGFRVDEEARKELVAKYIKRQVQKEYELYKILGYELNVASPKQVGICLYQDLKFPQRKGTGEDVLVALMGNHAKTDKKLRVCELIIEVRKIRKTIGTYLLASPDYDGRMRTSVYIIGNKTGRTSDQILEPPIRPEEMGLAFKTMTKHGDIGADLRTIFIPDEGTIFVNADLRQAESWVVALLSEDEAKLSILANEDIHSVTASWVYGGNRDAWTKFKHQGNEPPERFIGKTLRHAGERGMGKKRLMEIVNTDSKKFGIDITLSEYKAGLILDIFHRNEPSIRESYFPLIQKALAENKRTLVGPYGRMRIFFEEWGDDLFKEAYSQLPQQAVSDKIKMVMRGMKKRRPDLQIILEGHDAFLAQVRIKDVDSYVKDVLEEMAVPIPFDDHRCTIRRRSLRIPCDVEIGEKNYKDLKKWREGWKPLIESASATI